MLTTGWIRRSRMLPYRGDVLVSLGSKVDPWTPVARIGYLPGTMTRVDVALQLNVPRARIGEFMLKRPGDAVASDEAMACRRLFFEQHKCYSPVSGVVGLVSKHLGLVYIREPVDLGTTEPADIDVAGALGVAPLLIGEYLNCSIGRMVTKDQALASRRKAIGQPATHVLSPTLGQVTRIDRQTGHVTVNPLFKSRDVIAYICGEVVEILPDEGVTVQAYATTIDGVFGVGGETFGELYVAVAGPADTLTANDITEDMAGRIVVAGKTVLPEAFDALKNIGVRGLIVGYLPVDAINALSPGLNMGITGKEDVPFTVIITEGFRETEMSPDVFHSLKQNHGQMVSCNGTTHIRAGVIRPEIIVPTPHTDIPDNSVRQASEISVVPGTRVRLLRRPYAGARGVVTTVHRDKTVLESGISAQTCTVRLDRGEIVVIPKSNCTPI